MLPVLETPDGEFVCESDVISQFAEDYAGDQGLPLWPSTKTKDSKTAVKSAHLRLALSKLDKLIPNLMGALI